MRPQGEYVPIFLLDFNQTTLVEQVKGHFFKSLRARVEEELNPAAYSDYVERFYQSRFHEIYSVRAGQIAEEIWLQYERFGREGLEEIDRRILEAFEGLLDYFIIQFCPDLNGVLLPETMLRHERVAPGKTDLWALIRDFLDFSREEETVYVDFIAMPEQLLLNTCKSFLVAERREKVFFIADLSLKGSCKEGFAMTDKGLYWRAPFDKPRKVLYQDLQDIKRHRDWLTINGHFFTANPSLNLKMYKLLKKLRGWRPATATVSGSGHGRG